MLAINVKVLIGNRVSNYLGSISFEVYLVTTLVFNIVKNVNSNIISGVFIFLSLTLIVVLASLIKKLSTIIIQCIGQFITLKFKINIWRKR